MEYNPQLAERKLGQEWLLNIHVLYIRSACYADTPPLLIRHLINPAMKTSAPQ